MSVFNKASFSSFMLHVCIIVTCWSEGILLFLLSNFPFGCLRSNKVQTWWVLLTHHGHIWVKFFIVWVSNYSLYVFWNLAVPPPPALPCCCPFDFLSNCSSLPPLPSLLLNTHPPPSLFFNPTLPKPVWMSSGLLRKGHGRVMVLMLECHTPDWPTQSCFHLFGIGTEVLLEHCHLVRKKHWK